MDAHLTALLDDPDLWDEPAPDVEASIVASIVAAAEAERPDPAGAPVTATAETPDNVVPISRARRWIAPFLAGAAAVLLVVAAVAILPGDGGGDGPDEVSIALEGTEEAPGAAATADVADTPLGTRIILSVAGLPQPRRTRTTRRGSARAPRSVSAPGRSISAVATARSNCGRVSVSTSTPSSP